MYHCYVSQGGIGDAVCGLYAACGLADALGKVYFHTYQAHWLDGFAHPNLTIVSGQEGVNMGADYDLQLNTGLSRKQWYVDQALKAWGLDKRATPTLAQTRPNPAPVLRYSDYVVLVPFADFSARVWPGLHWAKLGKALTDKGLTVIAIGRDEEPLRNLFLGTSVEWYWGHPHEYVKSVLANASCVVGNDSGMTHLAGLFGVPTVALIAQLSPRQVFSHTDISCITPMMGCSPCAWSGAKGWLPSCDTMGCSALYSISPDEVAHRVLSLMLKR